MLNYETSAFQTAPYFTGFENNYDSILPTDNYSFDFPPATAENSTPCTIINIFNFGPQYPFMQNQLNYGSQMPFMGMGIQNPYGFGSQMPYTGMGTEDPFGFYSQMPYTGMGMQDPFGFGSQMPYTGIGMQNPFGFCSQMPYTQNPYGFGSQMPYNQQPFGFGIDQLLQYLLMGMQQMPFMQQQAPYVEQPLPYTEPDQSYTGFTALPGLPGTAPMPTLTQGQEYFNQTEISVIPKGVWGDPHFEVENNAGELLTTDHKGVNGKTYNILDSKNGDGLVVDALYSEAADPNNPQVMTKARVMAGNEEILFDKDGNATLNGQKLEKGKEYTTKDGTKVTVLEDGNVDIVSKEGDANLHLNNDEGCVNIKADGKWHNGNQQLGGVYGTLLNNRDKLGMINNGKVTDINGDGKSDDLNGNGFIEDEEWAKLGYNFDVTRTRAIA
ncbi:MAG TPA: hypothetical protein P5556_07170 [Candidatus Gastranaerophilales bacterium]|nr:hypothetical protein [Candidatus Gastranaerophilales bacterium]